MGQIEGGGQLLPVSNSHSSDANNPARFHILGSRASEHLSPSLFFIQLLFVTLFPSKTGGTYVPLANSSSSITGT